MSDRSDGRFLAGVPATKASLVYNARPLDGTMREIEGELNAEGLRVAIVAARFNDEIVSELLSGAVDCLQRHGARENDIAIFRVPGSFEIPAVAARLAQRGGIDAIVALGCLIRGETPHFELISSQVTNGLSELAVATKLPIAFGVITCNTIEQAWARTRKGSNKGWEAALAAVQMAGLFRSIGVQP